MKSGRKIKGSFKSYVDKIRWLGEQKMPDFLSIFRIENVHVDVKFIFSKKAKNNDEIFTVDLTFTSVKSTVKIASIFVPFLENMNFR